MQFMHLNEIIAKRNRLVSSSQVYTEINRYNSLNLLFSNKIQQRNQQIYAI
jgi:hypothetical protein